MNKISSAIAEEPGNLAYRCYNSLELDMNCFLWPTWCLWMVILTRHTAT